MNKTILTAENISKQFTDKVGYKIHLLENISLSLMQNEFLTILAPKGSGKTSLLKIMAGLEKQSSGKIFTQENNIPFIPSLPSSFPWLNVFDNICFNSNLKKDEIDKIINLVGLAGYEDHFPHNKSEGFRFRISLGRALAVDPKLIVIDEPFNNLKDKTREEIYILLRKVYNETKISIVFGTTNITEAIFLSDNIHLMKKNPGEIIECVKVNFPAERNLDVIEKNEFKLLRNNIEETFKTNLTNKFYNFSV
ncbi:MAG: ATP-binding cassette domain-containing protein [Ignavibacteriae bacterium]|nr:ATP-binding cassette domain-containing protein [Ignavibacteriota bacterium]